MTAFRKQLCAVVILVLISVALSKPHSRRKRSVVKDYFNPLTYPTTLLTFEKGEDGKYHPSNKSAVEYVLAEAMDSKNEVIGESAKTTDSEASDLDAVVKKYDFSMIENPEEATKKELLTEDTALLKQPALAKSDAETTIPVGEDEFSIVTPKEESKLNSEVKFEAEKKIRSENMDESMKNKIDLTEHKFTLMPKPDSKDEKPYEGQFISDEYGPQPPADGSGKEADGKLGIGQFPILLPPFLPHGIQLLFRPRHFPGGQAPLLPVPPAVHISDRLPILDADVIEEGSETAIIEDVDTGDTYVKGMRRVSANRYNNPMSLGIPFPMIPFHKFLKEITGEGKLGGDIKSEILEVMGKKMLVQKKVLKYPGDNSKLHFRVMSMQPLDDVDPEVLKELDMEEEAVSDGKDHEEKESKEAEESLKKSIINENEANVGISVAKEGVKGVPLDEAVNVHKETEAKGTEYALEKSLVSKEDAAVEKDLLEEVKPLGKLFPQSDILKVEETQVNKQVFVGTEGILKKAKVEGESKELDSSKTVADGIKPELFHKADDEMAKTMPENVEKDIDSRIQKHESDEKITKTLQTDELLENKGVDKDQIEADKEKHELIEPEEQVFEDVVEPSEKKLETRNMLAADAKNTEEKIEETATQIKKEIAAEETAEKIHASGDTNKHDETNEEKIQDKADEKKHSKDSDELEKKNIKVEEIETSKSEHVLYEKRKKIISEEKDKKEVLNKKGKKEKKCKCEKDKDSGSDSEDEED